MFAYAIRRFFGALPTLFIIVTLTFFMMRAAPGGPFDTQRHLPPEIEHNIKAAYDLDKPLYEQYFIYLGRLAHGDLGPSFKNKDFTVTQLIARRTAGQRAARAFRDDRWRFRRQSRWASWRRCSQNGLIDYSVMSLAMFGITIPDLRHRADPHPDLRRLWHQRARPRHFRCPWAAGTAARCAT